MSRSTKSSASRVLLAAIALIMVCGALLILPKKTNSKSLTVSIAPAVAEQATVPLPAVRHEPQHHIAANPVQDERPNQIEVPQPQPQLLTKNVRVAMLQPTTQLSPPADPDFFEEFESNLIPDGSAATVERNTQTEINGSDAIDEPIDIAQAEPVPVPMFEPEPVLDPEPQIDPELASQSQFESAAELPTQWQFESDSQRGSEVEPTIKVESETVVPTQTIIRQQIDTSGIEAVLTDIRNEMSRITELRLRQARAEQFERIDRLERQIEALRLAQENPKPVQVKVNLGRSELPDDSPASRQTNEPVETRQQTEAFKDSIQPETSQVDEPAVRAEAFDMEQPMAVAKPFQQRETIEYPPPEMEPVKTTKTAEVSTTDRGFPAYEFIPQNSGPILQPFRLPQSQPVSRGPQCTRSSPRVSLLSRLRTRRSTPCKYCGKIH